LYSIGGRLAVADKRDLQKLAKQYGGVVDDSNDNGHAAFEAMIAGGRSQFNAVLGGGRDSDGRFRRLDAHGFYWTSTETSDSTAWLYNFGKGGQLLNHHHDIAKRRAFSVRCMKER